MGQIRSSMSAASSKKARPGGATSGDYGRGVDAAFSSSEFQVNFTVTYFFR